MLHSQLAPGGRFIVSVFFGFTRAFCSKSEWGSTQSVLIIILYWREQISRNCTYLLPNKRSTHTVKNYFPPMTVYRFWVDPQSGFSQSEEISLDLCYFYGGGIRHNEDIMHSFQNFIARLIPNHPPSLETRIWKLVVRALPPVKFMTSHETQE